MLEWGTGGGWGRGELQNRADPAKTLIGGEQAVLQWYLSSPVDVRAAHR